MGGGRLSPSPLAIFCHFRYIYGHKKNQSTAFKKKINSAIPPTKNLDTLLMYVGLRVHCIKEQVHMKMQVQKWLEAQSLKITIQYWDILLECDEGDISFKYLQWLQNRIMGNQWATVDGAAQLMPFCKKLVHVFAEWIQI